MICTLHCPPNGPVVPGEGAARHYRFVSRVGVLLALLLFATTAAMASEGPRLEIDEGGTRAGHFTVSWDWIGGGEALPVFDIEMDRGESFSNPSRIYRGRDGARVMSGMSDGTYYFRGRVWLQGEPVTAWSEPVRVEVAHHSLGRALTLFLLGALVFGATVAVIVIGQRRTREENSDE